MGRGHWTVGIPKAVETVKSKPLKIKLKQRSETKHKRQKKVIRFLVRLKP